MHDISARKEEKIKEKKKKKKEKKKKKKKKKNAWYRFYCNASNQNWYLKVWNLN